MVGVVGIGIALPNIGPLLDGLRNVQARIQNRKIQQSGSAPEQRGAADLLRRSRPKITLADDGRRNVSMWFDATGHHHHPRSVDHPTSFTRQNTRCGHRHNLFSPDRHIPHPNPHRSNNFPAPNNQIQHFSDPPAQQAEKSRPVGTAADVARPAASSYGIECQAYSPTNITHPRVNEKQSIARSRSIFGSTSQRSGSDGYC